MRYLKPTFVGGGLRHALTCHCSLHCQTCCGGAKRVRHIPPMPEALTEKHIHGADTTFAVVRAHTRDARSWLKGAPVCQALAAHQIVHAGVMVARDPYQIVRQHPGGVYFLACVEGEGRVLVDGRWQRCAAGMAVALPAFMANAFHAVRGKDWRCVWVRYEQAPDQRPLLSSSSPLMTGPGSRMTACRGCGRGCRGMWGVTGPCPDWRRRCM